MKVKFILAVDIVEYSLLSTDRQKKAVYELSDRLELCPSYHCAFSEHEVIKCPAGDGFILVFDNPEPALNTAAELQTSLQSADKLKIRQAIHFGTVELIVRAGDPDNVAGEGANYACRAMGAAQPGEILLTETAYNLYSEFSEFSGRFVEYGVYKVKHGKQLELYKLVDETQPQQPARWESRIDEAKRLRKGTEALGIHRLASETTVAKRLDAIRRDKFLAPGVVLVAALLAMAFRNTSFGKQTQMEADSALQTQAVSPSNLNVRVMDIGSRYDVQGTDRTDLKKLQQLLQLVLSANPTAVVIDIDFCTDLKTGHPYDPEELVLAPALRSTQKGVPVFLAVHRGLQLPPEQWLGDKKYLVLAAHPEVPKPSKQGQRLMLSALRFDRTVLPSLAGALAKSVSERVTQPPRWIATQSNSRLEVDVDGEPMMTGGQYFLNASSLDRLKVQKVDLTSGRFPVEEDLSRMRGQAILIGTSTEDPRDWEVLGQPGRIEKGLFLHAVGAVTLAESPIYVLRPWARFMADLFVGGGFVSSVIAIRKRNLTTVDSVSEGKVVVMMLILTAFLAVLLGVVLIKVTGILWSDLLLLPFLLLFHPRVRVSFAELSKGLRRLSAVTWRRLAFLPNGVTS